MGSRAAGQRRLRRAAHLRVRGRRRATRSSSRSAGFGPTRCTSCARRIAARIGRLHGADLIARGFEITRGARIGGAGPRARTAGRSAPAASIGDARPRRRREYTPYNRRACPSKRAIFIAALAFRVFSALVAFLANVVFPAYQDQGFSVFRHEHLLGHLRALRRRLVPRHRVAGLRLRRRRPQQPRVLSGLSDADARRRLLLGGRQEDYYFAGIVVSWLAFAAAMSVLYRLALLDLPRPAAIRAVMYAAVFPFAYFFGMVYSESLFLLALVVAVYALRTRALAGGRLGRRRDDGDARHRRDGACPAWRCIAWRRRPAIGGVTALRARRRGAASRASALYSLYNYR